MLLFLSFVDVGLEFARSDVVQEKAENAPLVAKCAGSKFAFTIPVNLIVVFITYAFKAQTVCHLFNRCWGFIGPISHFADAEIAADVFNSLPDASNDSSNAVLVVFAFWYVSASF